MGIVMNIPSQFRINFYLLGLIFVASDPCLYVLTCYALLLFLVDISRYICLRKDL